MGKLAFDSDLVLCLPELCRHAVGGIVICPLLAATSRSLIIQEGMSNYTSLCRAVAKLSDGTMMWGKNSGEEIN